jgi:hypothetical protein
MLTDHVAYLQKTAAKALISCWHLPQVNPVSGSACGALAADWSTEHVVSLSVLASLYNGKLQEKLNSCLTLFTQTEAPACHRVLLLSAITC